MNITAFKYFKVLVPTTKNLISSYGENNKFVRTLIQIKTSDHEGWGEIYGDYYDSALNFYKKQLPKKHLKPDSLQKFWNNSADYGILQTDAKINNQTLIGIEMALNDLYSKEKRQPLYELLRKQNVKCNKIYPTSVKFSTYSYNFHGKDNINKLIEDLRKNLHLYNSNYIEFKLGLHGVEHDIKTVTAIRKEFGNDIGIRVDINMGYTYEHALKFINYTKSLNIITEEPVGNPYLMDKLALKTKAKISTHCTDPRIMTSCFNIYGLVPDLGIEKINNIQKSFSKPFWFRSAGELGIGFANMCHHILANTYYHPSQSLIHLAEDDLLSSTNWKLGPDGFSILPDVYGLGVKVDLDKMKYYNYLYHQRNGIPDSKVII